uniref:BCL3 transcription coactivator n=1 Tax=Lynx canadensis TaxID=61383 RepID=A0A667HLR0_LYNCA
MPRCPAGAMDEGPVDLRTRPKAAGPPGAALPLRKRPLRAPSPEPAAPRGAAGPVVTPDPLGGGSDSPAVPAAPHGLARPEALYYQGPLLPLYPTPTMGSLFPLLNVPTPLYPMVCSMEHPLSADIAVATRADEDGDTPLHIAVVQGNLPAVHRLVNLFQHGGRELDIYNNLRQTPLHLAVITTLPSVVRLLVMAGASPMALDRHGQTAAHLACEHRSPTCLRALLDSAAPGTVDLEARNYDGLTALHVAVNMECPEAVLLLLERGADIDAVDIKSGRSPLIHAVENNSLSMVQLLLQVRLPLVLRFQRCLALLGLHLSMTSPLQAALWSRTVSLSSPAPTRAGPGAAAALLTPLAGFDPFPVRSFRPAWILDPSFLGLRPYSGRAAESCSGWFSPSAQSRSDPPWVLVSTLPSPHPGSGPARVLASVRVSGRGGGEPSLSPQPRARTPSRPRPS